MTLYFLSRTPAALKLDGIYVGIIDTYERHIQINLDQNILAEIVPADNLQPLNFFLTRKLLTNPPPFVDIYLLGGDAVAYIKGYAPKPSPLKMLQQVNFCGNTVTLFSQGECYLSFEGLTFEYITLDEKFRHATLLCEQACGHWLLVVKGEGCVALLSEGGKLLYMGDVCDCEWGRGVTLTTTFQTCPQAGAKLTFDYDGQSLTRKSAQIIERSPLPNELLHYAFFEGVLAGCNCQSYLSEQLQPKFHLLPQFLGNFVSVTKPTQSFAAAHPNQQIANLIYAVSTNLYRATAFEVKVEGGKIENIEEMES